MIYWWNISDDFLDDNNDDATIHLMANQVSDVVNVIFDHCRPLQTETPGNDIHILCKKELICWKEFW